MGEWKRVKIGDVCTIEKGVTGLAKALPGDYPLVTTGAERKTSRDYQLDTKAVCIPLVSSTGHGKKTLNYVHYQEGKFALGSILSAVVPRDETILDARYLHVYLQKNKDRVLVPLMKGAANVSLSMTAISNIEVPLPSLVEQKKILGKIDSISSEHEDFLNESDVQIDLFGKLRQSVLQEAIEGKLTSKWRDKHPDLISGDNHASKLLEKIKAEKERLIKEGSIKKDKPLAPVVGAEKPFDLPEGWVWCRLGDWGVTQTGTTPSTFDTTNFGNFVPFIKPADISLKGIDYANEGLSEKGLASGRLISKNSILMVCIGGSIGKSYFTDRDVSCNQQINCITPLADVDSKLLQQFLQSKYFQDEVWDKAMKSSTPIINKGKWEEIPLPIPPLTEQQALLVRLDKIMVIIDKLERQIAKRKEQSEMLMQSVLREAFAKE